MIFLFKKRRLQNWGGLPNLKGMITEVLPDWLAKYCRKISDFGVFGEENVANHVLVNEYLPSQGIMPHVDGPMYYPTVSTISIGSHTLLDFYKPLNSDNEATNKEEDRYVFSLLIEPKSLLILQEDMYKIYLHGIRELKEDVIKDKANTILNYDLLDDKFKFKDVAERQTRISLTIRFVPKTLKLNSSNLFTKKKI
jgi:alkylated DNA repair protein alkB family protein 6